MAKDTVAKKTAKTADKKKRPGLIARLKRYFKETKGELKKVTWPTREEFLKYTGVVIMFIVLFAVIVGVMDYALASLVKLITG